LRAFCADRLAPFKVPSRVIVERELPKLAATGKIDKTALRLRARQDAAVAH
jgi:acyl-CoA synthetase (AMP-forming)/AMP-acid ligase II